jgi:hypothetical protein
MKRTSKNSEIMIVGVVDGGQTLLTVDTNRYKIIQTEIISPELCFVEVEERDNDIVQYRPKH